MGILMMKFVTINGGEKWKEIREWKVIYQSDVMNDLIEERENGEKVRLSLKALDRNKSVFN